MRRDPSTQPGLEDWDRFQTLSGVQYFFGQNFANRRARLFARFCLVDLLAQHAARVPDAPVAKSPPAPGVWVAPHGGYPVHWSTLVYARIYLKTFTRMTTMESANESGRHAVNAIVDHYNAHHGSTIAPPSPNPDHGHPDPNSLEADEVIAGYLGDYGAIWNMERYESPSFDSLRRSGEWRARCDGRSRS